MGAHKAVKKDETFVVMKIEDPAWPGKTKKIVDKGTIPIVIVKKVQIFNTFLKYF